MAAYFQGNAAQRQGFELKHALRLVGDPFRFDLQAASFEKQNLRHAAQLGKEDPNTNANYPGKEDSNTTKHANYPGKEYSTRLSLYFSTPSPLF